MFRFALVGGIVTLAVFMGHLDMPIRSAMISSFPALSISAIVAVRVGNKDGGVDSARGMTMGIFVSIMLMIIPFSVVVHCLYPVYGVGWGTLAAYVAAAGVGLPYYLFFEEVLVPSLRDRA